MGKIYRKNGKNSPQKREKSTALIFYDVLSLGQSKIVIIKKI